MVTTDIMLVMLMLMTVATVAIIVATCITKYLHRAYHGRHAYAHYQQHQSLAHTPGRQFPAIAPHLRSKVLGRALGSAQRDRV